MNLQEIFDGLASSELIQLSIGGQPAGEINEDNAPKLIPHINLALTALYTRFALKEGRLLLEPMPDQTVYPIDSRFAVNNKTSREAIRFLIDDALDPFKDDILKIDQVLTDAGFELPLNDEAAYYGAATPTATSLRLPLDVVNQASHLPDWLKTEHLELVYRAGHPRVALPVGLYDPSRVKLQLPTTHLEPLLYFVASRVNTPVGMNPQLKASDPYMARYELKCQELEKQGMQKDPSAAYDKLRARGWV